MASIPGASPFALAAEFLAGMNERPKPPPTRSADDMAAAAARGDAAAFADLRARFGPGLHRMLAGRTSGREDLADELAQATWVSVWQALSRGQFDRTRAAISTFIYAVGHKTWLQHLRRQGLTQQVHSEVAQSPENPAARPVADAGAAAGLVELIQAMRDCLKSDLLTSDERDVVIGSARGESDRDLARRLGMASSSVNARRRAAFDKIRRELSRRGFREDSLDRIDGLRE